ncbi:hypothetical protein EKN06_06965 [Croceicoccus ponticola]|uniref:Phosphoribosyltransferase n=1 Tax=Croceicoccus ponticola TaxID=2217664 RepID=A0A437GYC6_9SPHN|nr:hypothetical protein EKN06_06965 [Croceicoccus ponticola]
MAENIRLTEIDDSNRDLHPRLTLDDKCVFLFEYTSGKRWDFSTTNGLIKTLKRKPDQKGQYYKNQEIEKCGNLFRTTLSDEWLSSGTLVPIPPSKAFGDPAYDNRMERICRAIRPNLDVRLLVSQRNSTIAAHERGTAPRPTIEELIENYEIDETLTHPAPSTIAIFDDVLTAGTHFKAVKTVLSARFPAVPIYGIFIARRVFPEVQIEDWF